MIDCMILLGKLAHYEAEMQCLSVKWGRTLDQMRATYTLAGEEQPDADDDYIQWQWYADAAVEVQRQLITLAGEGKYASL